MVRCLDCGGPTPAAYGLCGSCRHRRLAATCESQGVPVKVTDPVVVDRVATLIRARLASRKAA